MNEPSATKYLRFNCPQYWVDRRFQFHQPEDFTRLINTHRTNKAIFIKDVVSHFSFFYNSCPPSFFEDKNVSFVFLVRDPGEILFSLYQSSSKKDQNAFYERFRTSDLLVDNVGLKQIVELLEQLKQSSHVPAKVIFSHQLYENPQDTICAFCSAYQIPFDTKTLEWKNKQSDFLDIATERAPPNTDTSFIDSFFENVINSQCFKKPTSYPKNIDGSPHFLSINNPKASEILQEAYEKLLPFYKQLLESKSDHLL